MGQHPKTNTDVVVEVLTLMTNYFLLSHFQIHLELVVTKNNMQILVDVPKF
jgi:hypothetical protein